MEDVKIYIIKGNYGRCEYAMVESILCEQFLASILDQ